VAKCVCTSGGATFGATSRVARIDNSALTSGASSGRPARGWDSRRWQPLTSACHAHCPRTSCAPCSSDAPPMCTRCARSKRASAVEQPEAGGPGTRGCGQRRARRATRPANRTKPANLMAYRWGFHSNGRSEIQSWCGFPRIVRMPLPAPVNESILTALGPRAPRVSKVGEHRRARSKAHAGLRRCVKKLPEPVLAVVAAIVGLLAFPGLHS
jgi:hypothetical protein